MDRKIMEEVEVLKYFCSLKKSFLPKLALSLHKLYMHLLFIF